MIRSSGRLGPISFMLLLLYAPAQAATVVNVNCSSQSLQTAINAASVDTQINISGTCSENILIDNDRVKLFLFGPATINGPDASKATFDVRGKAILLTGLTITGGRDGVQIHRSANAVISGNTIESTGNMGIIVQELGFAVIINNLIQNNPNRGIHLSSGASANIGFNNSTDVTASPNTIQGNGDRGIFLNSGSSARIVGNTIQNNTNDGIIVRSSSAADIAGNLINGNGGDGVQVNFTSTVRLGRDDGTTIFDLPNNTTVNNVGFGVNCSGRAVVDGALNNQNGAPVANPLTGTAGQANITAGCTDSTI